jgi:hypothetical protein
MFHYDYIWVHHVVINCNYRLHPLPAYHALPVDFVCDILMVVYMVNREKLYTALALAPYRDDLIPLAKAKLEV